MALAANAIVSFASIQGLLSLDATMQTKYEYLINVASARISAYCARNLMATDYTNYAMTYQPGIDTLMLRLPEYPVNTITSLYVDPLHQFGSNTLVTGYELDAVSGLIYFNPNTVNLSLTYGENDIRITFNAGYMIDNNVPFDLQHACLEYVKWADTRVGGSFIGQRYTNFEGLNTSFEVTMPQHVESLLLPYKRLF
jgi:hypothetical protein